MIQETLTLDKTIEFMNELVEADAKAIEMLVETRVPCTDDLAEHPTLQVTGYGTDAPKLGLLGILNGLFGIDGDGWGAIAAVFDDEGRLTHFKRVTAGLKKSNE